MKLKVYNGEIIQRGPLWYVFFISLMIFLVLYSFFNGSLMWAISVAFIFLVIIVGYVISYLLSIKKTEIILEDGYLRINDKTFPLSSLVGFNIDLDENWNFKNFVIVTAESNFPFKFTINDSPENVKEFVKALLDEGVPLYNGYEQDKMYKLIKMLKLG